MYSVLGGFPAYVTPLDTILMAFATFRITRLIVYDKITRWFRELFLKRRVFEQDGKTFVEISPYGRGFLHTIYNLLECPWCIGFWSALVVVVCYFIFPWAWVVIYFLALAGASTLLQLVANNLGWRAENLKLDAHTKEASGATSDHSGL